MKGKKCYERNAPLNLKIQFDMVWIFHQFSLCRWWILACWSYQFPRAIKALLKSVVPHFVHNQQNNTNRDKAKKGWHRIQFIRQQMGSMPAAMAARSFQLVTIRPRRRCQEVQVHISSRTHSHSAMAKSKPKRRTAIVLHRQRCPQKLKSIIIWRTLLWAEK